MIVNRKHVYAFSEDILESVEREAPLFLFEQSTLEDARGLEDGAYRVFRFWRPKCEDFVFGCNIGSLLVIL